MRKRKSATGSHLKRTDAMWLKVYRRDALIEQNHKCCYCTMPLTQEEATADHLVARAQGGATRKRNIRAACRPCNQAKAAMPEKKFKRLIKNPAPGDPVAYWLAWAALKIDRRTEKAEMKILEFAA